MNAHPEISDFGRLLTDTFKACEGRSFTVLDRVLTAKVRAWADDQQRIPDPVIADVEPWENEA